jgi:DNA-binding Lrp family transcriptional regulator
MAVAHVLINCENGSEDEVITELKKFDSITEVRGLYGSFDIIVKLESPNLQELKDNVSEDIRKIKKIISTVTLLHIDNSDIDGVIEN